MIGAAFDAPQAFFLDSSVESLDMTIVISLPDSAMPMAYAQDSGMIRKPSREFRTVVGLDYPKIEICLCPSFFQEDKTSRRTNSGYCLSVSPAGGDI